LPGGTSWSLLGAAQFVTRQVLPGSRWSPAFPELLLSQPERCGEALAKVEAGRFEEVLDAHYASV